MPSLIINQAQFESALLSLLQSHLKMRFSSLSEAIAQFKLDNPRDFPFSLLDQQLNLPRSASIPTSKIFFYKTYLLPTKHQVPDNTLTLIQKKTAAMVNLYRKQLLNEETAEKTSKQVIKMVTNVFELNEHCQFNEYEAKRAILIEAKKQILMLKNQTDNEGAEEDAEQNLTMWETLQKMNKMYV
ncbi:Hypothetical_protein [Hexamita inflata]|uniref:Hypothetical_protein n=1 Tax=Hexamita inflata TaxID=28002 RepID=A0AA86PM05_9EUKA|nr:Hypothetical protein HINF_LOCUS30230 [Hexamita inflata]